MAIQVSVRQKGHQTVLCIVALGVNVRICRRASAFSMVQVASAATCVLTRPVSRGVCRVTVTAVGRLAETAVDGPQRAGDMYQNPAARLWLIEDVGMYKPTVLRTGSQVRRRWLRS
jgi:hypothetical protein